MNLVDWYLLQMFEEEKKKNEEMILKNQISQINHEIQRLLAEFGQNYIDEKFETWEGKNRNVLVNSKIFPLSYLNNFESSEVAWYCLEFAFYLLKENDADINEQHISYELNQIKNRLSYLSP